MVSGCVLEVIGHFGRVLAYNDLFHKTPFLIQIVCLTIAPAFLAAGIYLCLARIIQIVGVGNSRIKPRCYPAIFITADVISLVLQATGGGISSVRTHQHQDTKLGDNIMIVGLAFQVFTMLVFELLALDVAICTLRSTRQANSLATIDPHYAILRKTWIFRGFLAALSMSTLCIFMRCVFRVAELSGGWSGDLMRKQHYFIGLEGAVIVVAVLMLNMFHPGLCLKEKEKEKERGADEAGARTWFGRKKPASRESSTKEFREVEVDMSYRRG
ncbi:RTA-like protein [Phaeosphaeria sp. MPI-PUGE-AT-0046c]|nr:RTA-like protein [Phaeosphaeria sp. MPI-PUGE-AT-0046c]